MAGTRMSATAAVCPLSGKDLVDLWGNVYYLNTGGEDNSFGCWATNLPWVAALLWGAHHVWTVAVRARDSGDVDEARILRSIQRRFACGYVLWSGTIFTAFIFHKDVLNSDTWRPHRFLVWNSSMIVLSAAGALFLACAAHVDELRLRALGQRTPAAMDALKLRCRLGVALVGAFGATHVWIDWEATVPLVSIMLTNIIPICLLYAALWRAARSGAFSDVRQKKEEERLHGGVAPPLDQDAINKQGPLISGGLGRGTVSGEPDAIARPGIAFRQYTCGFLLYWAGIVLQGIGTTVMKCNVECPTDCLFAPPNFNNNAVMHVCHTITSVLCAAGMGGMLRRPC